MLGRLIRVSDEYFFLCKNGTVITELKDSFLIYLMIGFQNPESFSGNGSVRWDSHTDCMDLVPGETIAYISLSKSLVINESTFFSRVLSFGDIGDYISAKDYAVLHGKSVSRIKALCSEGRVAGAVRISGQWLIPKYANYPADRRHYNKRAAFDPKKSR